MRIIRRDSCHAMQVALIALEPRVAILCRLPVVGRVEDVGTAGLRLYCSCSYRIAVIRGYSDQYTCKKIWRVKQDVDAVGRRCGRKTKTSRLVDIEG